jgi:hypothetical protein
MVQHIDQWFAFVQNLQLEIDRMQDIILVTGCHRAKSWVNVAFSEGQRDTEVSFRVPASGASGIGIKRQLVRGDAMLKPGPWDEVRYASFDGPCTVPCLISSLLEST